MRGTAWMAGAGACAIMVTAGCGSAHYQGAATTGHQANVRHPTPASLGPPTISAAQAQSLARDLLARVQLPAGARLRTGAPPAALSQTPGSEGGSPVTALHRLWTAGQSTAAVLRFWSGHAPAGMAWNGSGSSGSAQFVGYGLKQLPAGVSSATLTMSVTPAGPDASVIRADVQVIWYPPRSAAEQLPGGAHAVTITATPASNMHPVTKTFTSATLLSRLAGMLNGVHAAPRGEFANCPANWVGYRIAFATSATAAPFLVMTDAGCSGLAVTADGHAQPALEFPAGLGALLESLTGVRDSPGTSAMHPA
jgi:hypothetical protein